jgi:hypothetical protein
MRPLEADAIIACLHRHEVRYVLIGGLAAVLQGYEDLVRGATTIVIRGQSVRVAALEDIIRSKEAAGRAKDLAALPVLRLLLEQIRERGAGGSR